MALTVYNHLTRRKEEFRPVHEGAVHIYVCGPTVYDHAHIGHAKTYISFDTIVRYFRYLGYQVRYVQNLTDVGHLLDTGEDRILRGVRRERVDPMELVETYIRSYFEDMDALNVGRPNISPRPTCHITEQIELAQKLIETGHAYEANMASSRGAVWRSRKRAHGFRSWRRSGIRPTLPCGRPPSPAISCAGPVPGGGAILAGTRNAR
jgi:cysteinyl-tRNA synthetase